MLWKLFNQLCRIQIYEVFRHTYQIIYMTLANRTDKILEKRFKKKKKKDWKRIMDALATPTTPIAILLLQR